MITDLAQAMTRMWKRVQPGSVAIVRSVHVKWCPSTEYFYNESEL